LRAQLHLEGGDAAAAAGLLERALALEPGDMGSRGLLVQAYSRLGRSADSKAQEEILRQMHARLDELTALTRKVTERPQDASLHARMAELYEQLNMPEPAARHRRNAALFGPPAKPGSRP
jgi:Tfp pilus assembly protein PilF